MFGFTQAHTRLLMPYLRNVERAVVPRGLEAFGKLSHAHAHFVAGP